jgi:hypothetical protein
MDSASQHNNIQSYENKKPSCFLLWERRESDSPWRPKQPLQHKKTFKEAGLLPTSWTLFYTFLVSVSLATEGSQIVRCLTGTAHEAYNSLCYEQRPYLRCAQTCH